MSLADALNSRRLQVWNEMQELVDRTDAEGRSFSGEEESKWTNLNAEITKIDERIKQVKDAEARTASADAAVNRGGRRPAEVSEFRSFLMGNAGKSFDIAAPQGLNYRTLSKLSAGAGANTVPTGFYSRMFEYLTESAAILTAGVTVLNTTSGEQILVPTATAGSTSAKVAEAGTIGASDPTFGQMPLDAYKYAHLVKVSRELLTDSGVDIEGYLARESGRALGNKLGEQLVIGDGSGDPNGVHTASTTGVTGAAALGGGFGAQATAGRGADYLIDLFYSVIAPYRASSACNWMMSDATAAVVRKLKDSNGQYVWQPSVVAGTPDMLLGKPVIIDPNVPDLAVDTKSILFGDFAAYHVRLAGGIRFERSDDFAFDTDVVTFRAIVRGDGDLADTAAIKGFLGGAVS